MFPRLLFPGLVSTLAAVMPLSAADPAPDTEAYFTRFVQPVLESTCTHCHNADQQKGDECGRSFHTPTPYLNRRFAWEIGAPLCQSRSTRSTSTA